MRIKIGDLVVCDRATRMAPCLDDLKKYRYDEPVVTHGMPGIVIDVEEVDWPAPAVVAVNVMTSVATGWTWHGVWVVT